MSQVTSLIVMQWSGSNFHMQDVCMLQTDSKTLSDNSDFIFGNKFLAKFFFKYEPFQKYVVTKF